MTRSLLPGLNTFEALHLNDWSRAWLLSAGYSRSCNGGISCSYEGARQTLWSARTPCLMHGCCLQAVPGMDVAALAARVQALEDQQQHLQQSLQSQLAVMDSEMHHLHSSVGSGFERLQVVSGAPGVQAPGSASSKGQPAAVAGTSAASEQQGPASRGLHSPASGPAAARQEQARPPDPAQAAPPADEGWAGESNDLRGGQAWQPEVAAVAANVAELREAVEDLNGRLFELRVEVQNLEGDVGINIASIKLKVGLPAVHK